MGWISMVMVGDSLARTAANSELDPVRLRMPPCDRLGTGWPDYIVAAVVPGLA